ncbi:MAG TPA: hypothetical protein VF791_17260 [Pyrinomonadaceae bacterium]
MKHLFATALFAALVISSGAMCFGQERGLELNASVVGQQSCSVNSSMDALQLTVRLRYTNAGNQKLILYKGNRIFYQVFISRSREEAAARRYEMRATHARYDDAHPERIEGASPSSVFTVLPPGASYEATQVLLIPVARVGAGRVNVSIPTGEHVLYLQVSTWYESKKLAEDLRRRWNARGLLWTEPVASNAVGIVVDNRQPTAVCR